MKKLLFLLTILCVSSFTQAKNYLCFTANEDSSSIAIYSYKLYSDVTSLLPIVDTMSLVNAQYSTDGGETWKQYMLEGLTREIISLPNKGDKILFKGSNPRGFSYKNCYYYFVMTGSISASGSVMSLLDGKGETDTIPWESCFIHLFKGCSSLTTAPELPATVLAESCYKSMFSECSSLTAAPALPATQLESGCYAGMFEGCVSLKEAPELPSLHLSKGCYSQMFKDCENLEYIKVAITSWDDLDGDYDTGAWVSGVAPNGTFVCCEDLRDERGIDNIPRGWTVMRSAPSGEETLITAADNIYTRDGHLFVDATQKGVAEIRDLGGRIVERIAYETGESDLGTFPAGIYVVNGRKVVMK